MANKAKKRGGDVRAGHWDRTGKTYRGKAERKQAQILHKAAVKKRYTRVLKQYEDDTPEFYKEIFAQVDEEQKMQNKRHKEDTKDTEESSADNISRDNATKASNDDVASKGKRQRVAKPNPLRRAQQIMEEQQRKLEEIRQNEQLQREQREKEIAAKKKQREVTRKRMMTKTRKGQPAMAGRIANMLDQLKMESKSN
ncbi:hypothetical protein BDF22DRAFT_655947 [Syncephalis plumigaleata]|nr:hypothetical protein BDF22DRAFT_655947 [Syncephalis plumigaleata]